MNSRRILIASLIGGVGVALVGLLLLLALIMGADIGRQKAIEMQQPLVPVEGQSTTTQNKGEWTGEEYIPVVMRVSGEEGTRYRCRHSNISDEGELVQEEQRGELLAGPVEYRARIPAPEEPPSPNFYANCTVDPDPTGRQGKLRVELVVNGQIVDSGETRPDPPGQKSTDGSTVGVSYLPQAVGPDPAEKKE